MDEVNEIIETNSTGLTESEEALLAATLAEVHGELEDTLPTNSKSLLIDESTSRFSSAEWFEKVKEQQVTLAGLGGIGSYVAFLLGRLKINRLILWDDDTVDMTNLSGQFYSREYIGNSKVSSIAEMLREYSGYYSYITNECKFSVTSPATDIMICGFDNMVARDVFYNVWKDHVTRIPEGDRSKCLFIDGRLAAEEFQVFCIKGDDDFLMKKYENEWLFSDDEAEATLCSYKQTSFCANMIASVMVNLFVNFIANQCNPLIERELPFYTSYDAERMYFKTEQV